MVLDLREDFGGLPDEDARIPEVVSPGEKGFGCLKVRFFEETVHPQKAYIRLTWLSGWSKPFFDPYIAIPVSGLIGLIPKVTR